MRLFDRLRARSEPTEERAGLVQLFESWHGLNPKEGLEDDFLSYVTEGYKANGIVFAVILARMRLFADIQFTFRNRRTKELFGTQDLALLENPWPNGTSRELLSRMEQDVSLAGNAYVYAAMPGELQRLRPDWVQIVTDGRSLDGYIYTPGGKGGDNPIAITPEEMCHWAPIPDPKAAFRGMSWLTPLIHEIQSDTLMTRHKEKFFTNAATPNLLVKTMEKLDPESRERLKQQLDLRYAGAENAYKSLVLEGGADATVIGSNMQAISFDAIQAAGENRIAAAAGVPGIVAGLKEGLQAATYSNYQQAMRHFVDLYAHTQWGSVCAALDHLVAAPGGAELWYDTSQIQALRQNELDKANIELVRAQTIEALIRSGYDAQAILAYAENWSSLSSIPHTGIVYFPGAPKDAVGTPEPAPDGTAPPQKELVPIAAPPALPAANGASKP